MKVVAQRKAMSKLFQYAKENTTLLKLLFNNLRVGDDILIYDSPSDGVKLIKPAR